jgi:transcriptional regulator with PAS, ATPase and Fis domain
MATQKTRKSVNNARAFGYSLDAEHEELRCAARLIVKETLQRHMGNRTHAARELGVTPATVFAWLAKWPDLED